MRRAVDLVIGALQGAYGWFVGWCLRLRWVLPLVFIAGLVWAVPVFQSGKQSFLPQFDEGQVAIRLTADAGISLDEMDRVVARVEGLLERQPEVESVFSQIGGFVFGLGAISFGVGGLLPLALMVALTGLEIVIAFLQAYVFAILTCLYINDALHLH